MKIWSECIADRSAAGLASAGRYLGIGARHSTTKRGIGMDEFPDVTCPYEPDIPSYESDVPYTDEGF